MTLVPLAALLGVSRKTVASPVQKQKGSGILAGEGVSAKGRGGGVSDGGDRQGGDF